MVFTRSGITPPESERIWMTSGALWVHCQGLALADFGIARDEEPCEILFLSRKQCTVASTCCRLNFMKFEHNTSIGVAMKTFGTEKFSYKWSFSMGCLVSILPLESIQSHSPGLFTPYKKAVQILCDIDRTWVDAMLRWRSKLAWPDDVNFAIQTWNVVLVSECRFVFETVVFVSEFCVFVVEEHSVLRIYSFTFETPLNSGILRSGSTKWRFCLRKPFLAQKVVCIVRFRWPLCTTISWALRAEYCIVDIPRNTSV